MRMPLIILLILSLAYAGQTFYFYPQLPETIASHFDSSGHVNGFMAKSSFFAFETGLIVLMSVISFALERLLVRMPDSMINVPNKEYWLAPERREQTLGRLGGFFASISVLATALFIAINQIVLSANLSKSDPEPAKLWTVAGIFLVCEIGLVITQLKRFLVKPMA